MGRSDVKVEGTIGPTGHLTLVFVTQSEDRIPTIRLHGVGGEKGGDGLEYRISVVSVFHLPRTHGLRGESPSDGRLVS